MQKPLLLTGLLLFSVTLFSQVQGIRWKSIVGTENNEKAYKIIAAPNGGYLTVGEGFKNGTAALLLMKFTATGSLEWSKTYGGSGLDFGKTGVSTPDGGYLIVGATSSVNNDGDVTGHHGVVPAGTTGQAAFDVWVLKIDANGNILWTKTIGGTQYDLIEDIIRTSDNNYLLTGSTLSGDGDLTGIARPSPGNTDFWVFKMDGNGNIIWQKCFGGSDNDEATSAVEMADGFVLTGRTLSYDLPTRSSQRLLIALSNIFVVKINASGNMVWQKSVGGMNEDYGVKIVRKGTHVLIGGYTNSADDVVGYNPNNTFLAYDVWIAELDETGALVGQRAFGSVDMDFPTDMAFDHDLNLVVLCKRRKGSDLVFYPAIAKLNQAKEIVYEQYPNKMPGTTLESLLITDSGAVMVTGHVNASKYNEPGDHLFGGTDVLLLEFGDVNSITGKVFLDQNANGVQDMGEPLMNNLRIVTSRGGDHISGTTVNGTYTNKVDTGSYTSSLYLNTPNYSVVPASVTSTFTQYFDTAVVDFAVQPLGVKNDLRAVIVPLTCARPGFQAQYKVKVFNAGTVAIANPQVQLDKDQNQTVMTSTPAATGTSGNTINWQLAALAPLDSATIYVTMQLAAPPMLNLGDTLRLNLVANPLAGDQTPFNNADTLKQIVVGSLDPNDKTESHGGVITPAQVSGADPLTYTIRFQNMGTDTAFNITVRDTLDSRLDWTSLEMIDASHGYQLSIDGNKLTWLFSDIKLPDHTTNEPASHGYIVYQIKPLPTVPVGDTIRNGAGIYFDYNLPVLTNVENTAVASLASLPVTMTSFQAVANKGAVDLKWETATEENVQQFEVQRSSNGLQFNTIGIVKPGKFSYLFKDQSPVAGNNYYRIHTVDLDGDAENSAMVLVSMDRTSSAIASIYPNPGNGRTLNIALSGVAKGNVQVLLFDQMGRAMLTKQYRQLTDGLFKANLHLGALPKGAYILKVVTESKTSTNTLVIQ